MLVAEVQRQLVDARVANRQTTYHCPACHAPVRLHRGRQVPPYFAHLPQATCVVSSEGETPEHLRGKRQLAAFFCPWGPATLERVLPTIHQRADVWIGHQAQPVAVEFQCSPLALEAVAQRTAGYRQLAVYPLWLLGHRYRRQRLNWRLIERFASWLPQWGLCLLFWDVRRACLVVRHHLRQDAVGHYWGGQRRIGNWAQFLLGTTPPVSQPALDDHRIRLQWTRNLQRQSPQLRLIQEQLYLTGHHLAGFPGILATPQSTAPVFGQGLLLWRIVMGAWLFQGRPELTVAEVQTLSHRAYELVGGHARGVRFQAAGVLRSAQEQLLTDLVTGGYLVPTAQGWRVQQTPRWFRDYADWLKNNEKIKF